MSEVIDLSKLNTFIVILILLTSLIYIKVLIARNAEKGDIGFYAFWAFIVVLVFVINALSLSFGDKYWVDLSIDCITNSLVLLSAYALYKRNDFSFLSKIVSITLLTSFSSAVIISTVGWLFETDTIAWRVFLLAPVEVVACVAFAALTFSACCRVPEFKVAIIFLGVVYTLIQVPAYHAYFIEPKLDLVEAERSYGLIFNLLIVTKTLFLVYIIAIPLMLKRINTAGTLQLLNISLTLFSIGLTGVFIIMKMNGM